MHFLKPTSKRFIIFPLLTICTLVSVAQDQLASIAPVDKRMRAIDSVSLSKLLEVERFFGEPSADLYPTWDNKYISNYAVEMPKEYKIDLRGFHMPCESKRVTSSYGYRRSFRRNHYGTDLKVYVGDTIRSAFAGKIRIVANQGRKGYGKYVVIRHYNGLETVYGHLSKQLVVEDQEVKAGEVIGLGGNTGRSTGSHLHFETRFLGKFINPETLFDFDACDILNDFYLFSSVSKGKLLTASQAKELPSNDILASMGGPTFQADKEAQSKAFQEERRQSLRASVHRVQKGESLSVIARKRGTTVAKLCKLNNIKTTTVLRVGQILKCS